MHSIAEHNNIQKFQKNLQRSLRSFKPMKSFLLVPSIYCRTYSLVMLHRGAMRDMRKALEECSESCASQCQAEIYEYAKSVRDSLDRMLKLMPENHLFSHLRYLIERCLDDWDDVAEDAYVGQDKEFRDLVNNLAAKV